MIAYLFMFIAFTSAFYIVRLAAIIYKNTEKIAGYDFKELFAVLILLGGNIMIYMLSEGTYSLSEPFAASVGGIALVLLLFNRNQLQKYNKIPKIIEKLYNNTIPEIYARIADGLNYTDNFIFANYKPVIGFAKILVKFAEQTENKIMNRAVLKISNFS